MKKSQHLLVVNDNDLWQYLFSDVKQQGVKILVYPFGKKDAYINKLLFKMLNNRYTKKKLGIIWQKYVLFRQGLSKENSRVLLLNPVLPEISDSFLSLLKEKYHAQIFALFIDSLQCFSEEYVNSITPLINNIGHSKIFTFDTTDAERMNWVLTHQYYSSLPVVPKQTKYDVFLILYDKGRAEKAIQYYDFFEQHDIRCLFYISGVTDAFACSHKRHGVVFNQILEYHHVIDFVTSSRVILEICQDKQSSNTLRAFEAVVYNKKLVTNNRNIRKFPYFDSRHMKEFADVNDLAIIEKNFFKSDSDLPNYNYQNEFSPINLFDRLEMMEDGE